VNENEPKASPAVVVYRASPFTVYKQQFAPAKRNSRFDILFRLSSEEEYFSKNVVTKSVVPRPVENRYELM
jgi:hypothetical protein